MDCELGNPAANLTKAEGFLRQMSSDGVQLAVLPELFATGYRLDEQYTHFAEPLDGPTVTTLEEWASRYGIWVAAAVLERATREDGTAIYDTAVLISPLGLSGKVRKRALWADENLFFKRGTECPIFPMLGLHVGFAICYEVGLPELVRPLALQGADVIVVPSAFGLPRLYAWNIATRARALENGCYLLAANRIGTEKNSIFCGHSRIVSPRGEIMREIPTLEGWAADELNLTEVSTQRTRIPYLEEVRRLNER